MSILIANPDAAYYRDRLQAVYPEAVFHAASTPAKAAAYIDDARALIAFANGIDTRLIARAPCLEWVQALSSGTEKFVECLAGRPEVMITSSHGVQGPAVAEMAFVHMLTLARDLPRIIDNQRQAQWTRFPQPLLHGKTVVIVGTGLIANELAMRCKAFGMATAGISGSPRPSPAFDEVHGRDELARVAGTADFMVVLVPLADETRRLIDARVIASMKPTAILINLARGGVCDEHAILEAVKGQRLAAAGLDVFETEPLPSGSELWMQSRILITPHLGGESDRYTDQVLPILIENTRRFLSGEPEQMKNRVHRSLPDRMQDVSVAGLQPTRRIPADTGNPAIAGNTDDARHSRQLCADRAGRPRSAGGSPPRARAAGIRRRRAGRHRSPREPRTGARGHRQLGL